MFLSTMIFFFFRELDDEVGMGEIDIKVNLILSLYKLHVHFYLKCIIMFLD